MQKKIIFNLILLCFFSCSIVFAYDDKDTHKRITAKAAVNTKLESYLIQNLGLKDGLQTKFPAKSENSILFLLREGSALEDSPVCRTSNHFHNPIKSWDQSYMSDAPWFINKYCSSWQPIYSNITWGTGYLSPDGSKVARPSQWMGWGDARDYYYWALTATSGTERETYFAKTFQALGQVSHLLQDISVPAHVRNDFTSHLSLIGFISINPVEWFGSLYEDYVKNNPGIVESANPKPISLTNPTLTDFWDTDRYKGDNPSASPLGLAEFTNANYFSDTTIINNKPSEKHYFNYPVVTSQNSQICEDYILGKNRTRKYVSRKDRGECPPVTEERKADHFTAVSILQSGIPVANENLHLLRLWLDKNVHDTYARDLVPKAISYSAALLDYFFRGEIQVVAVPILYKNGIQYLRVKIKNMTPNETMKDGEFTLTYSCRPSWGKADGSDDVWGQSPLVSSGTLVYNAEEIVIDFWLPDPIPKENYNSAKFTLAFKGKLGNEEEAVIGKALSLGEIKFSEEWDNGLNGNYTWAHTDFNLFDQNPANGSTSNVIYGDTLIKENIRVVGHETARVNESFLDDEYNNGQFRGNLPILITPETYLQFKIDAMWINEVPPAPPGYTNHWQALILHFNNGLSLQYFQEGQGLYTGSNTAYFTFPLGLVIVDNIYEMFKRAGIAVPEPLYLESIDFLQQLLPLDQPSTVQHHQHMEIDSIRIIEGRKN